MKPLYIIFYVIAALPAVGFAGTQAECVQASRDFNDKFSANVQVGLDVKTETPTYAVAIRKGHDLTTREGAALAPVLRTCATSSLGRWVVRLRMGETKGTNCEQRNLETMSAVCGDSQVNVKFRKF